MREITFRGKRIDTEEWVTGHFVRLYDDKGHHSHRIYPGYAETDCGDFYPDWYEVDPETVGQFTGLTDKHGKPIFEGDILGAHLDEFFPDICTLVQVIWFDMSWMIRQPIRDYVYDYDTLDSNDGALWEVIGNIHDNPELIGGKTDG